MKLSDYITTGEAAKKLGYANTNTLAQYCREGRILNAVQMGGRWLIPKAWVENELKEPTIEAIGKRGPRD